jgi:hypothetical protein
LGKKMNECGKKGMSVCGQKEGERERERERERR